jgi:hypothetical protein
VEDSNVQILSSRRSRSSDAASGLVSAQSTYVHAPDGGTRVSISSIFIPAVKNAPFQATVTLELTRHLADGSTVVTQNHRLVMRDSQGDIFQERRTVVPHGVEPQVRSIEISNPSSHTKYYCDPGLTQCELRTYNPRVREDEATVLAEPRSDERSNFKRIDLGAKTIEGVDAIGAREILTIPIGARGNSAPMESTREYWYSPQLQLNLRVLRLTPLQGDQSLAVTDLRLSEPDPHRFAIPPNAKIVDSRGVEQ